MGPARGPYTTQFIPLGQEIELGYAGAPGPLHAFAPTVWRAAVPHNSPEKSLQHGHQQGIKKTCQSYRRPFNGISVQLTYHFL